MKNNGVYINDVLNEKSKALVLILEEIVFDFDCRINVFNIT